MWTILPNPFMYKVPKIHITNVALHTKVYSHENYSLNANKELYKM